MELDHPPLFLLALPLQENEFDKVIIWWTWSQKNFNCTTASESAHKASKSIQVTESNILHHQKSTKIFQGFTFLASECSSVAELLPHHPKVKGLSPAAVASKNEEKWQKWGKSVLPPDIRRSHKQWPSAYDISSQTGVNNIKLFFFFITDGEVK